MMQLCPRLTLSLFGADAASESGLFGWPGLPESAFTQAFGSFRLLKSSQLVFLGAGLKTNC
jgi:hypothetical protein